MENWKFNIQVNNQRAYIFLILACLAVYSNSLSGDFVFDDIEQIVGNLSLRSWQNAINAFTTDVWAFQRVSATVNQNIPPPYYRPLFTLYLTIGYGLFGLWQQGWHLLSLAVHSAATILSFRLFLLLSKGNIRPAFIGALLFALIPVHVESVSWITGIPDPLASLFYIPSIIFYIRWRESGKRNSLILSLIFFFLALLCKETPIILPLVLIVWEATFNKHAKSDFKFFKALKSVSIFAVPAVIYLIMRLAVLGKISWNHPFITQSSTESIYATIPFVITYYLKNIIFPFNLSLIYPTRFVAGFDDSLLWIPLIILFILTTSIYLFRKHFSPLMPMALGLFLIPLLPVLNLKVFHYEYIVQDRYLYLPSIGFVLFIACLIEMLFESKRKSFRQAAVALIGVLCISYAVGTFLQNRVWNSQVNLWRQAVDSKSDSWANHYNLGLAYLKEENYDEAIKSLNTALNTESFDRKNNLIYVNLGLAKKALGKSDEAKKDFVNALKFDPKSVEALTNLGAVYFDEENYAEAETQLKNALTIAPSEPLLKYNLARVYGKTGRDKEAINIYENLLQNEKQNPELLYFAAISYKTVGQTEKAAVLLNEAQKFALDNTLKQQIENERRKLSK